MAGIVPKKSKNKRIQNSDPGKILDLVMSLTDDSCSEIQMKINTYICDECEADLVFQVIVHCDRKEAFVEVIGTVALPRKTKIKLTTKFVETLRTRMDQTELLSNFNHDFQDIVKPYIPATTKVRRVVLMPLEGNPFSVIFCIIGARITACNVPIIINECSQFIWPTLKKAIAYENECSMKIKCQHLLRVAKRLFTQVASLETLLQSAMDQAKHLIKADHCVIMLIDVEKMELYEYQSPPKVLSGRSGVERRFSLNKGICGEVIRTGNLINTKIASEHPLFDPRIDCLPDVRCKSLLCFPIREQSGIIGVGLLINKIVEPYFDGMDEEMALSFSIYCGVCIIHAVVYQKIQEAHIRNALATELVMYHMKVREDEVSRLMACTAFHQHPHIASLHFNPRALPLRELPCYALKILTDLGFDTKFNIKKHKLARFVLYVKKGYRDVAYHNWMHAFNVTQWAYASIVNFKLCSQEYFTDLQAFMYVIACLLHDIDHRGTTNSFQIHGHTNLAALYSSEGSVMERHHLAQAMCILNTEGCDILESFSRRDFDRAIMMLRDNILATDLSNYFKNQDNYKLIAIDYQKPNKIHFSALQNLLMNAADLSDNIKDWGCVKKSSAAVLTEFFKQGELEKLSGHTPMQSMDRDKCFIPDLQIEFLENTVIPLYELLAEFLPKLEPCTKIIESHIEMWEFSRPVFAQVPFISGLSVLLSPELDGLIELNKQEAARLERERLEAELLAAQVVEEEEESD